MAFTAAGLTEQRTDLYSDITGVAIISGTDTVITTVAKASFANVADGSAGAISFEVNLTGAVVGVGTTVKGYRIMKSAVELATGNFDVQNTAQTTSDTFKLTFTINNS